MKCTHKVPDVVCVDKLVIQHWVVFSRAPWTQKCIKWAATQKENSRRHLMSVGIIKQACTISAFLKLLNNYTRRKKVSYNFYQLFVLTWQKFTFRQGINILDEKESVKLSVNSLYSSLLSPLFNWGSTRSNEWFREWAGRFQLCTDGAHAVLYFSVVVDGIVCIEARVYSNEAPVAFIHQ